MLNHKFETLDQGFQFIGKLLATWCFAFLFIVVSSAANAQKISLIRDAEIEGLLKSYTGPIFKAAKLRRGSVDVHIINNRDFNAFVTDRNMFINTGAILGSQTPNEIIGVIAHETGHIIGAHQVRIRDQIEKAQILGVIGALIGAGAMASGNKGAETAGAAILSGTSNSIMRGILAYKRDEEAAADQSALKLLNQTKQSGAGILSTFKSFNEKLLFSGAKLNPYIQSHPLPKERIALLERNVRKSPFFKRKDPSPLQLRHDMARAKIAAYTQGFRGVQRLFKKQLTGQPARYGMAISQFLSGRIGEALKGIDALLKKQPKNAYLHEMKAEILLRAGKADNAIKPMQTAIKLDRYKSGLLQIQYGQILLSSRNPANARAAVKVLNKGLAVDPDAIGGYSYLARAYAKIGREDLALASTAEQRFRVGDFKNAKKFALRAQQKLKKNSPEWLRLQDIVLYKPKKK